MLPTMTAVVVWLSYGTGFRMAGLRVQILLQAAAFSPSSPPPLPHGGPHYPLFDNSHLRMVHSAPSSLDKMKSRGPFYSPGMHSSNKVWSRQAGFKWTMTDIQRGTRLVMIHWYMYTSLVAKSSVFQKMWKIYFSGIWALTVTLTSKKETGTLHMLLWLVKKYHCKKPGCKKVHSFTRYRAKGLFWRS